MIVIFLLLFFFICYLMMVIATWIVYKKAGRNGWSVLVPFHSQVKFFQIAGKPGWWIFLFFIPILNLVLYILTLIGLSRKFGHGAGFAMGLLFLPFVFYPILAFGKSKYITA